MTLEVGRTSSAQSDHPHGDEAEHDSRVHARLAELAAERGTTMQEVLQELNAALSAGKPLVTGSNEQDNAQQAGLPSAQKGVTVDDHRPADDVWKVTSLRYTGPPTAQRTPCAGAEPCP